MKLNLSKCWLRGAEAGKAIGDMLATNTSLKELDLSGWGPNDGDSSDAEFAKAFAVGLGANGALASLDLSQNSVPESEMEQIKTLCQSKEISLKI